MVRQRPNNTKARIPPIGKGRGQNETDSEDARRASGNPAVKDFIEAVKATEDEGEEKDEVLKKQTDMLIGSAAATELMLSICLRRRPNTMS
jgi:hypothetical protein